MKDKELKIKKSRKGVRIEEIKYIKDEIDWIKIKVINTIRK